MPRRCGIIFMVKHNDPKKYRSLRTMIYLMSDPHGGEYTTALDEYLSVCTSDDILIILGDLGINFGHNGETEAFTQKFLSLKENIIFIEGNHDNHPYFNSLPEAERYGDRVNVLTENIVRLKRGGIFEICGKTFFVMGGCESSAKWKDMGLLYEGEDPTAEEIAHGIENLKAHGNKVDYILTHKYSPAQHRPKGEYGPLSLYGLMDHIDENVEFTHWYAGHWHLDKVVDEKHDYVYGLRKLV